MSEFKEGDVVYLKSGGPAMTITEITPNDYVWCTWFDKDQKVQGKSFIKSSITKNNPDKPVVI
ncbi:DUF2158 domain-containing protein [Acinetobacter calcoaceticus]|jgi:uncharacterized protein YodC (DUF2158 family)|uniref:YodC family protein n=1 Tax=Acinetobacter TaxID=469 RepID=UPI0006F42D35|nr:DUF2158 domain-containing protein [Acinetobacter sp. Leaf130]KQQ76922.1 hypothetical protein ASF86_05295 [Acinetobacter sp. Leaf130]